MVEINRFTRPFLIDMDHNSKIWVKNWKFLSKKRKCGSITRKFSRFSVKNAKVAKTRNCFEDPTIQFPSSKVLNMDLYLTPYGTNLEKFAFQGFYFRKSRYPNTHMASMTFLWVIYGEYTLSLRVCEIKDIKTILNIDLYWFRRRLETDI